MKKRFGFTLAEVLVSLVVVGVVAAMTIPSLMQNYQKDVYITSLRKAYNDIDHAIQRKMTDMNADTLIQAGLTSQNAVNTFIEQYFKYTKVCTGKMTDCMAGPTEYYKIGNISIPSARFADTQSYILSSGASIRPYYAKTGDKMINFLVDTNGKSKPNVLGRDLFILAIYNNGLIDDYDNEYSTAPMSEANRNSVYQSRCRGNANSDIWGCFGKILNDNWEMKY